MTDHTPPADVTLQCRLCRRESPLPGLWRPAPLSMELPMMCECSPGVVVGRVNHYPPGGGPRL